MAIKKTRNTFEGGIDQDTSFELVKNNTATSLKNGMITKNGEQGVFTTSNGFTFVDEILYNQFNRKVYRLSINTPIPDKEVVILMGGNPAQIKAVGLINNTTDLYNTILEEGIVIPINMNGLYKNNSYVYIFEQYLISSFSSKLTVETFPYEIDNVILGIKEINLDKNRNLIFYFHYNYTSETLGINILEYNTNTNTLIGSDIIYREAISLSYIDSENIIYNKEAETKHSLSWCDGVNPDKIIYFNTSLDSNNYANFSTYIDKLRIEIYSQSENNLSQSTSIFLPRPFLHDLIKDDIAGKLKPGESVLFFYRLKRNSIVTNISYFSQVGNIPQTEIAMNSIRKEKIKYLLDATVKYTSQFIINDAPIQYDFIEGFVIHYKYTGEFKVRKLKEQVLTKRNIFSYNEEFDTSDLKEVDISDLYKFNSSNDISKEQLVYKNRIVKANLKDSALEVFQNFDARAYRFKSTTDPIVAQRQQALLYTSNGNLEYTLDGTGTLATEFASVADTADAVNKFNDEYTAFSDWNTNQQYKFKADGTTIGGQGLNISYTFEYRVVEDFAMVNSSMNFLDTTEFLYDFKLEQTSSNPNPPLTKKVPFGSITSFDLNARIFQGGEVYRFFIVIWKGDTPSLSKWIGDIKIPENRNILDNDVSYKSNTDVSYNPNGDIVALQGWKINFNVDTSSLKNIATAISIGHTLRDPANKSVLATLPTISPYYGGNQTGVAGSGLSYNTVSVKYNHLVSNYLEDLADEASYPGDYTADQQTDVEDELAPKLKIFPTNLLELGLVDTNATNLYLKNIASLTYIQNSKDIVTSYSLGANAGNGTITIDDGETIVRTTNSLNSISKLRAINFINEWDNNEIILNDYLPNLNTNPLRLQNSNFSYITDSEDDMTGTLLNPVTSGHEVFGSRMAKSFVVLEAGFDALENDRFSLVSIRKKLTSQYDGDSYAARLKNSVQLASYDKLDNVDTITLSPEGDTYVNYVNQMLNHTEILPSFIHSNGISSIKLFQSSGMFFPLESTVNHYNLGENNEENVANASKKWTDYTPTNSTTTDAYGTNLKRDFNVIHSFTETTYLDAISNLFTNKITVPVLSDTIQSDNSSTLIVSEKKVLGQSLDNWLVFKVNNSKTLDPIWGEINKLDLINNDLFVFQRNAISQQFVERTATQINDNSQIVLGTGEVLDEHIYLLRNNGVLHPRQVLNVDNDLLFLDIIRKQFISLKTGEILGMKKYFDDMNIADALDFNYEFIFVYDRQSNMVFLSPEKYTGSNSNSVILYDNTLKKITSDGSFEPIALDKVLNTGVNNMLSFTKVTDGGFSNDQDAFNFYRYNQNFSNMWFDSATKKMEVSFIVNQDIETVKTFDNLFIQYEVKNSNNADVPALLPESIQVNTNYQDTGVIALTTSNFQRRGRYWRFTIPRNSGGTDRVRDYWAKITIVFPVTNNQIKLIEVITSYRYSNLK